MYKPGVEVKARRFALAASILVIIFAISYFSYKALSIVSKSDPGEVWKSFSGAFFGALLGLLTLSLTDWVKGISQKSREAHDALVHLELYLNDLQNTCFQNVITLRKHQEHVLSIIQSKPNLIINPIGIFFLQSLPENWRNVRDMELINQLFSLNLGIQKLNKDLADTLEIKTKVEEVIRTYPSGSFNYEELFGKLIPRAELIIAKLESTKESIIDLLALVRCILKAKPPSIWLTHYVLDKLKLKINPKDIQEEKVQMIAEIEDILRRSTERENTALSKAKANAPP